MKVSKHIEIRSFSEKSDRKISELEEVAKDLNVSFINIQDMRLIGSEYTCIISGERTAVNEFLTELTFYFKHVKTWKQKTDAK